MHVGFPLLRGVNHYVDEEFHPCHDDRVLCPLEKRIDDPLVFGVLCGIRFDRHLPHRTDLLLRGNGYVNGASKLKICQSFADLLTSAWRRIMGRR